MDETRWLQLKNLFRQAYDLPTEERSAFLCEHCPDPKLRAQLESLLQAERYGDVDPGPGDTRAPETMPPSSDPPVNEPPKNIGPYRLLECIGEGGFGIVYMAEQEQPVRRRVALKIIKPGMESREVVARLEQERQALALMDHPNIARVFDGGTTSTGQPFIVMELVRGVPINEYCDSHRQSIRERLELFVTVCNALQHAHQKGVIHRDLKPSNILVGTLDGRAHVKVIDFGIAKAMQSRLTEHTLYTRFGNMIGTPQYMSPEQAEGSVDIDTRSDVYSLGVVLYELLTGAPPFDVRKLGSLAEIQRVIREQQPAAPSTRLGMLHRSRPRVSDDSGAAGLLAPIAAVGSSILEIARQRRTDAAALVLHMRGEPDWIVLRALEKDRLRRYDGAAALAADVQRYLRNEPILAGPPSRWYRLRKLIRRNRGAVTALVGVAAALVLGVIGTTSGWLRANEALRRAAQETRNAQAVQQVLQEALSAANPFQSNEPNVPVRELLERTAATLSVTLAGQPEVEAAVRSTIGAAYISLGLHAAAERQYRRVLELLPVDGDHLARAEAELQVGRTLLSQASFADAAQVIDAATAVFEQHPNSAALVAALLLRGDLNLQIGKDAAAKNDIERANSLAASATDLGPIQRIAGLLMHARLFERDGDLVNAEATDRAALDLLHGVATPTADLELETCNVLNHVADVRKERGDMAGALDGVKEALTIVRRRLGEGHIEYATVLDNLADIEIELADLDAAEANAQRALQIRRRHYDDANPTLLASFSTLGHIAYVRGKFAESADYFRRAIDGRRRAFGAQDPELAMELGNLGSALNELNQPDEALGLLKEAMDLARRTFGNQHPSTISRIGAYGTQLIGMRRFEEAEQYVREALAGNRRLHGDQHPLVARDLNSLAQVHFELGNKSAAEGEFREAIQTQRALMGPDNPSLVVAQCNLCAMLNDTGRSAEAEPLLRDALRIAEAKLEPEHPQRLRAMMALGVALTRTQRASEGELLLQHVIEIRTRILPPGSPILAHTRGAMGECLTDLGRMPEAEALLRQAFDTFVTLRGLTNESTREQIMRLASLYDAWQRPADAAEWRAKLAVPTTSASP